MLKTVSPQSCSRCSLRRMPNRLLRRMLASVALRTSSGSRRRSVPSSSSKFEGVEERLGPLSGLVVHLCGGCGYVEPRNASPIPQDAPLPGRRSPPPQNETTDTGQVDRYQREQAYDGTQMVCDDRAFAYRLVHRLTQRRALRKQG